MSPRDVQRFSVGAALALLGMGQVQAQSPAAPTRSPELSSALTSDQVRDYAQAFVLISQARASEKAQAAAMPDARGGALDAQVHDLVSAILQRFGLDRPTFNRISACVEKNPALRQRVQQFVMAAQVGA